MKKKNIVFITIISLFILFEFYLRIFRFETLKTQSRDLAYIPDTLYGYLYKPNSEFLFKRAGICKKVRFNNHGWYGPDFSEIKRKNSYRIIFVGNSVTLGIRTNSDKNFVMKLQDLFNQANYNVEVINCSVDGKNRDIGNMNIIKYEITKYHPDLVMYEYHFPLREDSVMRDVYKDYVLKYDYSQMHDSLAIGNMKRKIDRIYSAKILRNTYDIFFSIRLLCRWLNNNRKSTFAKFFNTHILKLEYITAYINKEKGIFVKEKIKTSCTEEVSANLFKQLELYLNNLNINIATYNLGKNYSNLYRPTFTIALEFDESLQIKDEGHLNDRGHEKIAKRLFYELTHSKFPINTYKIN